MSRRRGYKQLPEPVRCRCENGPDRAKEHAKPGKTAADHGNPFTHEKGCIHSELQHCTKPQRRKTAVKRLRLR